jgi:hypothetical protein
MPDATASSRPWSYWLSVAAVVGAIVVIAVSALHLLAASSAWLTPFNVAVSAGLALLALLSLLAVASDVIGLRIAIPVVLLGRQSLRSSSLSRSHSARSD